MTRTRMIVMTGLVAAVLATGCSSTVLNQGGDTSCTDFTAADEAKQNETLTKMVTDEGNSEPANLELAAVRTSVQAYCRTVGKPDSKISEAPRL